LRSYRARFCELKSFTADEMDVDDDGSVPLIEFAQAPSSEDSTFEPVSTSSSAADDALYLSEDDDVESEDIEMDDDESND